MFNILRPLIKVGMDLIDKSGLTKQEKLEFKVKFEEMALEQEKEIQKTIREKNKAAADIIVAEVQQDDKYTKRARPTVIYVGLVIIIWAYVMVPLLNQLWSLHINNCIPEFFWWSWSCVVGVYAGGRSFEKWKSIASSNSNPDDGALG